MSDARASPPRSFPNVAALFEARVQRSRHVPAFRHKEHGVWRSRSWESVAITARQIAAGLRGRGIERGEPVAIASRTRVEWALVDIGLSMCGAVSVPVYP